MQAIRLKSLLLFACLGFLGPTSYGKTGVTTTGVNIRTWPNGPKITVLAPGTSIEILETHGRWSKIRTQGGRTAFVFNKYIRELTEGNACSECENQQQQDEGAENREDIQRVVDLVNPATESPRMCIAKKVVDAAKKVVQTTYGGRKKGRGKCGVGVRLALEKAKIYSGGGIGNAKDMMPGLKKMGYVNILSKGMTPDSAPDGSILVYGAAPSSVRARCRGKGAIYGHIEIKESNDSYLYDGNPSYNIQEAFGAKCRPLIGVMQMGSSCPTCSASVKRTCGV